MKPVINVYNLGEPFPNGFEELNAFIVNGNRVILTDNEAVHTINSLDSKFLHGNDITISEFMKKYKPVEENITLGKWARTFSRRIESNYDMLLEGIAEIGLNPRDFPRK